MVSLEALLAKFAALASPLEPIEVSLVEAVGLVLAEPAVADVDLPPFDQAAAEGYAVRAREAEDGALLRVVAPPVDLEENYEIEAGESARVVVGAALPHGADAVLEARAVRSESGSGSPRVVQVVDATDEGGAVTRRGELLKAGSTLLPAGTRVSNAMVGLLAAQGCVHPLCHRRVRVALLAIGDHLVNASEAPILHRERNAANPSISALLVASGAMPYDLGCFAEADAPAAIARATNAPIVIVLGRHVGGLLRRLSDEGVEPVVSGLDLEPLTTIEYGVIRDENGGVATHVLSFPLDPVAASIATLLVALPLVGRLQGGDDAARPIPARLGGAFAPSESARAFPARLTWGEEGSATVEALALRASADLPTWAQADAVCLTTADTKLGDVVPAIRL